MVRLAITSNADRQALMKVLRDPNVYASIFWIPQPYSEDDAKEWITRAQRNAKKGEEYLFSVYSDEGQEYLGSVNLHREGQGVYELGYWLHKDHWGKGVMTEAVEKAMAYLREHQPDCKKVFATTAKTNTSAQHILEKAGFEFKTIKLSMREGASRESKYYELELK